jgi:hypothetical protein
MTKLKQFIVNLLGLPQRTTTKYTARISMLGNFLVAAGKVALGIFTASVFFLISGIYSIGIGYAKSTYYAGLKKSDTSLKSEKPFFIKIAITLFASGVVYIIYMMRLFFISASFDYGTIPSIGIAAISFLEIGMAIGGLLRAGKQRDLLLSGLRCINLSSGMTAIVFTQVALLSLGGTGAENSIYNAIGGVVFGGLCVMLSVAMVVLYFKLGGKRGGNGANDTASDTEEV